MSTPSEGSGSNQPLHTKMDKGKGKRKQMADDMEDLDDGQERSKRTTRMAGPEKLSPLPSSTIVGHRECRGLKLMVQAHELIKLVADYYLERRSTVSENAFIEGMRNVCNVMEQQFDRMQTPNISKLLEGNKCRHCGRKDAEGEGAADQPMYKPDLEAQLRSRSSPVKSVLSDVPPELLAVVEQQEGGEEGEALKEVLGEEDTSQAEQSPADVGEVGNKMDAEEDMYVGTEGTQAGTLEVTLAVGETLVGEGMSLSGEIDTVRKILSRADDLDTDLPIGSDVSQEEIHESDGNLVIALNQASQVRRTPQHFDSKTPDQAAEDERLLNSTQQNDVDVNTLDAAANNEGSTPQASTTQPVARTVNAVVLRLDKRCGYCRQQGWNQCFVQKKPKGKRATACPKCRQRGRKCEIDDAVRIFFDRNDTRVTAVDSNIFSTTTTTTTSTDALLRLPHQLRSQLCRHGSMIS
jgi:hypothetical protein